jgi:hypothetical protein
MQKGFNDMLSLFYLENDNENIKEFANNLFDSSLKLIVRAITSINHILLQITLSIFQLVFCMDIIHNNAFHSKFNQ